MQLNNLSKTAVVLALLFPFLLNAQTIVTGNITDADGGEPLIGVNILVQGTVSGTITDFDGNYELASDMAPPITLVYSLIGFETVTQTVDAGAQRVDLQMGSQAIMADEIIVSASRVEESILESPVTIEKLDLVALQQATTADFYDEVTRLKGVHHNQASLTFNAINARGFGTAGNTRFVQLQDGIDNAAPLLNFPTGNVVGISELDIKNVELIPGASSALYGPNAFNGILLMTSKDPFQYQGLSAQIKTGITDGTTTDPFYGATIRYAKSFNDKFAFKINLSSLFATDWEANDYDTQRQPSGIAGDVQPKLGHPAFDGINLYGDEALIPVGSGIRRTGFREDFLLDNRDASSLKAGGAFHYRLTDNLEANVSYQWGSGSTIYQGSERYGLRNFVQEFMKVELNSADWNIRAYRSATDDGDSYNMTALGAFANEAIWRSIYDTIVPITIDGQTFDVPMRGGWAVAANLQNALPGSDEAIAKAFADAGGTSTWSQGIKDNVALSVANSIFSNLNNPELQLAAAYELIELGAGPALADFSEAELRAIVEQVRNGLFQKGGAGFVDDSKLNHIEGNYNLGGLFNDAIGLQVGANYRQYDLWTQGTIFNEDPDGTGEFDRIKISEFGGYMQASKELGAIKLQGSLRYDKNQNFDGQVTPRVSLVYSLGESKNHNFRASYQTGFRNPTTQGQYIYFPTTNILLGGSRDNAERYGIYEGGAYSAASYEAYLADGGEDESLLVEQYLDYVRPEKLQSFEIGYKGISNKKLFVDASVYLNTYTDFITQNIVYNKEATTHQGNVIPEFSAWNPYFNAPVDISSMGFATSLEYIVSNNWKVVGNYTYTDFSLPDVLPVGFENYNPGFNTPNNKVNLGIYNRKFLDHFSAGLNARWQQEHFYFSSFGEGTIPSFTVFDAQVSYKWDKMNSTVKLGVNNILKESYRTNYGSPFIGRMVHLTITYDQFAN